MKLKIIYLFNNVLNYNIYKTIYISYNCDLLVFGPELAIDKIPRPVWVKLGLKQSSKGFPQIDSPPFPVPVGSPP